ncbi:acyltransferase family protein [Flexivirga lutea]
MRAIAVLLVVASHANIKHWLGGGYIGVDVFFVVSGFLITGLLAREVHNTGKVSFATFYARRARRILPAASVTLLLTLLVSMFVYTDGDLAKVASDVIWAAFFAANLNFAQAGTDYFAPALFETPVQHFWSLAVEEQFYLLWPVLIALMLVIPWRRRESRVGGPRATRSRIALGRVQALRRATVLIALLSIVSLLWSIHDTTSSPHSAYFSTFTRGWELGLGALLALTAHRVGQLPAVAKAVMSWTGLAAVLVAAVLYTPSTPFPGSAALVPVLGAVLILAGGIDGPRYGATAALSLRPLRFVGDISYSVYLIHWPVLVLTTAYAGGHLRIRYKLALIVLTIGLSWLCYRYVETPFRSRRRARHTNLRALAMWPAALALVLVPTIWVHQTTMAQSTTTAATAHKLAQKEATKKSAVSALRQEVATASSKAKAGAALPDTLIPSLVHLSEDATEPPSPCWAGNKEKTSHKICPEGDTTASKSVVVWGDSHAAQWLKPLSALAKQHHLKLIPLIKANCLPADVLQNYLGGPYTQCDTYRKWALQQIKTLKPQMVILSGLLKTPILDAQGKKISDAEGTKLFQAGAARTLQKLHGLAGQVDIISDQSRLPKDAGTCLGARSADMSTCAKPPNPVTFARDAAWKASAAQTGAHYVDMMPWECADNVCPIVVDGTIVYRDDHHLSTTYAERLKPVLAQQIDFAALA